jgi:hypothetical protein
MTTFDRAWDFVKQGRWADDFRQWARQNMDMEWFDSEYGIGSAEAPEMGFNFDEWDFQIREVAHQALEEELGESFGDDDVDEICETVSEPTWDRATNDQTNPMEGVELAIKMIQKWIEIFRYGGSMEL